MRFKKKIDIGIKSLVVILLMIFPVIYFYINLGRTDEVKLYGHVNKQHTYNNHGIVVTLSQKDKSEKTISSYNGYVRFNNIDKSSPLVIECLYKKNVILSQTLERINDGFSIIIPWGKSHFEFLITLVGLFSSIFFVTISLIILYREQKKALAIVFFLTTLAPFSFYLVTFIQYILANCGYEIIAGRIFALHRAGFMFFPPAFLLFCYSFSYKKTFHPYTILMISAPSLIFFPVLLSWIVAGDDLTYRLAWGFSFDQFTQIFTLYTFVCLSVGIFFIMHNKKNIQKYYQQKSLFFLKGVFLAVAIFSLFFLLPQLLLYSELFTGYFDLIVLLSQLILFGTLTYGAAKKNILDFGLILNQTLLYTLLSILVAGIYILIINTVYILKPESLILFSTIFIIMLFVLVEPMKYRIQKYLDTMFFPEHMLLKPLMDYYSENIAVCLDHKSLVDNTKKLFSDFFKTEACYIFFYDIDKKNISLIDYEFTKIPNLKIDTPEIDILTTNSMITLDQEDIIEKMPLLKLMIKSLNAEMILPIVFKNTLLGIILLSRKENSKNYSTGEIKLIKTILPSISQAIFNSLQNEKFIQMQKSMARTENLALLGKISASVAHEIKNPLAAIIPLVKVFPDKLSDPEFIKEFMDIVPRQLERINNHVQNFLNHSKPQNTEKEKLLIEDIIIESTKIFTHKMTANKIALNLNLLKEGTVIISREAFMSVFTNLIINAIEAINANGTITITTNVENGMKKIQIQDTGKGIPFDIEQFIFEPFFSTKNTGTGLGLSTASQIIYDHEGTIEVQSELDKGTCFTIWLPLF